MATLHNERSGSWDAPVATRGVTNQNIAAFQRDGVICVRGAFTEWVDIVAAGIDRNEREPSAFASNDVTGDETGRFFGDYCNWQRIPEYRDFVLNSPAASIAAAVMQSNTARIFHDHVLIKEPHTSKKTPWHHDLPYYNVQGQQTVSIWLSLDPVGKATSPEFVVGSHRWGKLYYPRRFRDSLNYDYQGGDFEAIPDIEAERASHQIFAFDLEPGDAVLFNFLTLHSAPGNMTQRRRRAFSTRWVGDDVTYAKRPGETSPPFNSIGRETGDPMPDDMFPVIWRKTV